MTTVQTCMTDPKNDHEHPNQSRCNDTMQCSGCGGRMQRQLIPIVAQPRGFVMTEKEAMAGFERLPERYRTLLDLVEVIVRHRNVDELFRDLGRLLPHVVAVDVVALELHDPLHHLMIVRTIQGKVPMELRQEVPVEDSAAGYVWQRQKPLFVADVEQEQRWPALIEQVRKAGVQSFCLFPLTTAGRRLGIIGFGSVKKATYHEADVDFLAHVAKPVALAVDNALAYEEIDRLRDKLTKEKLYLEEEVNTAGNFGEIIGDSAPLKRLHEDIRTVAAAYATVLILGETGSGKELVARGIHNLSKRRDRTFVKLNCAAIPTGLLESELFGHEKGAFTGAIAMKMGRFELADGGTLFLDEVGEIPSDLQVKLLRVLQEREFERLGGVKTIKVDVRVIAATNRDLERMVEEGKFRSDLYYRLNVFPITAPPLRDRANDIPLLVRHFAHRYANQMNKRIETISSEAMKALQNYRWPGNVRELENFVERAVILSKTSEMFVPVAELRERPAARRDVLVTLEETKRQQIMTALRQAGGMIGGPNGAAAKLGLKRTTLYSMMEKLRIMRPS